MAVYHGNLTCQPLVHLNQCASLQQLSQVIFYTWLIMLPWASALTYQAQCN